MPLFVIDGHGVKEGSPSMPGIFRMSEDEVLKEITLCISAGIRSFVLFPSVANDLKTPNGSYGVDPSNFYFRIARSIKANFPEILLMSDWRWTHTAAMDMMDWFGTDKSKMMRPCPFWQLRPLLKLKRDLILLVLRI
jgi:hypothetical protein